jgi:hypothetical protein
MSEPKERPILFSGPMVRAILEGRETQTRRVVRQDIMGMCVMDMLAIPCPYGQPGDRLWVRETTYWPPRETMNYIHYAATPRIARGRFHKDGLLTHFYGIFDTDGEQIEALLKEGYRKCPSIHMPRWASRLTLEVTSVRVERVQNIGEDDARAEGVELANDHRGYPGTGAAYKRTYRAGFAKLWDSINAKRGYSWESNPWVWVVEFRMIQESRP